MVDGGGVGANEINFSFIQCFRCCYILTNNYFAVYALLFTFRCTVIYIILVISLLVRLPSCVAYVNLDVTPTCLQ